MKKQWNWSNKLKKHELNINRLIKPTKRKNIMARKKIIIKDKLFECPNCGYRWSKGYDLAFDTNERCPCCPNCNELIEDGDDDVCE